MAKDWHLLDALVEEKLGARATDEARELGTRVEDVLGGSAVIARRKLDALAGVVGSGGAAVLVEAARRLAGRRGVKSPWPYLLRTLLSAAEELGDEAAPPEPDVQDDARPPVDVDDDPRLRGDLGTALGGTLPRMFSAARLLVDDQGRRTVVARDDGNRRDIEENWGAELREGGWRLAVPSGEKKGEVA